ncbi:MAG: hypothetical protein ACQEXJ_01500 [Myxococcota bacterium]
MAFDRALRVLGVDGDAGPREAKRAYLLLLQRYGPEPAPEIRRKLTAAWETLRDPESWTQRPRRRVVRGRVQGAPPVDDRVDVSVVAPLPRRSEPVWSDRSGSAPETPPAAPRGARRPTSSPPRARPADAARELEAALGRLASVHDTIDADALHSAIVDGSPEEVAQILQHLAFRGRVAAARDTTVTLLRLMSGHPERRWLEPRAVLRLALKLQEHGSDHDGALPAARDVLAALAKWRSRLGPDRVVLEPATADRLRWCRDLASLPVDFPADLRTAIARAVGRGTPAVAGPALRDWATRHKRRARTIRRLLEDHAPSLVPLYGHHLDVPATRRGVDPSATTRRTRRADPDAAVRAPAVPRWGLPALLATVAVAAVLWVMANRSVGGEALDPALWSARAQICKQAGADEPACAWARVVTRGLADEDCSVLERALPRLEGEIRQMTRPGSLARLDAEGRERLEGAEAALLERHAARCSAAR